MKNLKNFTLGDRYWVLYDNELCELELVAKILFDGEEWLILNAGYVLDSVRARCGDAFRRFMGNTIPGKYYDGLSRFYLDEVFHSKKDLLKSITDRAIEGY